MNNSLSCVVCSISNEKLLRCSQCKCVFYCSREHQKIDWKKHKSQCFKYQGDTEKENPVAGSSKADKKKPAGKNELGNKENQSNTNLWNSGQFTGEGSSESEILTARIESLQNNYQIKEDLRGYSEIDLDTSKNLLVSK